MLYTTIKHEDAEEVLGDAIAQCPMRRGKGLESIPIDRDSLLKDIAVQKKGNPDTASTDIPTFLVEEEIENRDAVGQCTKEQSAFVNEDITSQSTAKRNAPPFVSMEAFASGVVAGDGLDTSAAGIGTNNPPSKSETAATSTHDILQEEIRQLKQELAEMKQSKKRKRTGECQFLETTRRQADGPATRTRSKGA